MLVIKHVFLSFPKKIYLEFDLFKPVKHFKHQHFLAEGTEIQMNLY